MLFSAFKPGGRIKTSIPTGGIGAPSGRSWWTLIKALIRGPGRQALFDSSPIPIIVHEFGLIVEANAAAAALFGHPSASGMTGIHLLDLCPDDGTRQQVARRLSAARALSSGESIPEARLRLLRRDGRELRVRAVSTRDLWDGRELMVSHFQDESATVRAELALRESEALFEGVFKASPIAICISDKDTGRLLRVNAAYCSMIGRPEAEIVGRTTLELDLWPGGAEQRRRMLASMDSNHKGSFTRDWLRRADGRLIMVHGGTAFVGDPARPQLLFIGTDITAELEAFRARELAEAASQAKTAFLAVMSHELRTPLNGILGLAELARARDTKAAERKEYLNQLADCANSLADILNDILDLSKIEAGRMEINPEAVNTQEFFARLQSTYTSLAEARGLDLRFWVDPNLPRSLYVDPVRMRQILANYLGNALKFTPSGQIELLAMASQGRLRIEVIDSGIGIPADLLPRLFAPFEQAKDTTRSRTAGTGLGLAICHQLAKLMQGEVGVMPNTDGGSRFWVELPLLRPDAHAIARAQEQQEAVDVKLSGLRVLLAEDNEINALITMRALSSSGALAHRVADGQAAVEAVESAYCEGRPYAVVLMDVQMPVMDGLQATREIRMRACGAGLRVVALTAGALAEQREECRLAGMDSHLTKPLHRDRLLSEVLVQSKLARAVNDPSSLGF